MPTFSQRNGYTPLPAVMQPETMTPELRNTLWNAMDEAVSVREVDSVTRLLWLELYKLPVDSRPYSENYDGETLYYKTWQEVRRRVLEGQWYEVYDHVEFFVRQNSQITRAFNAILEHEVAAYRVVSGQVCQITDSNELATVQEAMGHADRFAPVAVHIQAAVQLMSDRNTPDYRNSIKESISAVESAAKIITANPKAELGDVLAKLEGQGKVDGALKKGFGAIYGWTSNQHGIRHGAMDKSTLNQADAKLFLVMCSAFTNYLKTID